MKLIFESVFVMNAKIENLSEMEKVLSVKAVTNIQLMFLFFHFGLGKMKNLGI